MSGRSASRLGGDPLTWALILGVGGFAAWRGVEELRHRKAAATPTTGTPTSSTPTPTTGGTPTSGTPTSSAPTPTTGGTIGGTTPTTGGSTGGTTGATIGGAPISTPTTSNPNPAYTPPAVYTPQPWTPETVGQPVVQPDGYYLPPVMPTYTPDPVPVAAPAPDVQAAVIAAATAAFQSGTFGGGKQPITSMPITSPALDVQPAPTPAPQLTDTANKALYAYMGTMLLKNSAVATPPMTTQPIYQTTGLVGGTVRTGRVNRADYL